MKALWSDERIGAGMGAFVLRIVLGTLFLVHLYRNFVILPGGIAYWWSIFPATGYPWFVPYYAISAEILAAVLLIPGIYTRWVALYALPVMIGSAQFWLVRKGFWFTDAGGEFPVVWSALLVVQALLGNGACALSVPALPVPGIFKRLA